MTLAGTQVIIKNPSRYSQTDPVLVRPRCSSPNHLLQAQLDWTLPTVLTQLPQPPMPPEPSAPLQPEVPPQPHTVTSEPAIPEDSGEESFTELPEQHLEADTTYLPSDTSLLMMSGTSFLRFVSVQYMLCVVSSMKAWHLSCILSYTSLYANLCFAL